MVWESRGRLHDFARASSRSFASFLPAITHRFTSRSFKTATGRLNTKKSESAELFASNDVDSFFQLLLPVRSTRPDRNDFQISPLSPRRFHSSFFLDHRPCFAFQTFRFPSFFSSLLGLVASLPSMDVLVDTFSLTDRTATQSVFEQGRPCCIMDKSSSPSTATPTSSRLPHASVRHSNSRHSIRHVKATAKRHLNISMTLLSGPIPLAGLGDFKVGSSLSDIDAISQTFIGLKSKEKKKRRTRN